MKKLVSLLCVTILALSTFLITMPIQKATSYTGWMSVFETPYNRFEEEESDSNVSNNMGTSSGQVFKIDSNNRPHIAWVDKFFANLNIFYCRFDGTNWVGANGKIYNSDTAENAYVTHFVSSNYDITMGNLQLNLDSTGKPHLFWITGTGDFYYVLWNGTKWVGLNGLDFDSDLGTNGLMWNMTTATSTPSVSLDSGNKPHIALVRNYGGTPYPNTEVMYIRWDGTNWIGANGLVFDPATGLNGNVSQNLTGSYAPQLVLNKQNIPHIVWYERTAGSMFVNIYHVKLNGSTWVGANDLAYDPVTGANAYITIGSWGPSMATTQFSPLLVLDSNNRPHISWIYKTTVANLNYIKWNGTSWVGANGLAFDPVTHANALVLDSIGLSLLNMHIDSQNIVSLLFSDYIYGITGQYGILKFKDNKWRNTNDVELNKFGGKSRGFLFLNKNMPTAKMQIDVNGNPCISFTSSWDWDIFFIRYGTNSLSPLSKTSSTSTNPTYNTEPKDVDLNEILNVKMKLNLDDVVEENTSGYLYDETPPGTEYKDGSATQAGLEHLSNTGGTLSTISTYSPKRTIGAWVKGEPPAGSQNVKFRWKIRNKAQSLMTTYKYSVRVVDVPVYEGVSQKATFVSEKYNIESNALEVDFLKKYPRLELQLTAGSSNVKLNDFVDYKITLKNTGDSDANNISVSTIFPGSLKLISSNPPGAKGNGKIDFRLNKLGKGGLVVYKLRFKLESIGSSASSITCYSLATCNELKNETRSYSTILITPSGGGSKSKSFEPVIKWEGLSKKESEIAVGAELSLNIGIKDDNSAFSVVVTWGDGEKNTFSVTEGITKKVKHVFKVKGSKTITIIVTDEYGSSKRIEKKINVI